MKKNDAENKILFELGGLSGVWQIGACVPRNARLPVPKSLGRGSFFCSSQHGIYLNVGFGHKNYHDLQLPRCSLSRLEATWDSLLESPSPTCALQSSERSASTKLPQKEEDID